MKIKTDEDTFRPITITLETVEEAVLMAKLIGPTSTVARDRVSGSIDASNSFGDLFAHLTEVEQVSELYETKGSLNESCS